MDNGGPIIFLFSAPSGTGKGTLVARLLDEIGSIRRIITVTTRPKRRGEMEGSSYYFVSKKKFNEWLDRGNEFIEWNGMYGDLYGTRKKYVEKIMDEARELGDDLVLEIDVDGKENFIKHYDNIVTVFILPPSLDELKRRIWTRKAESEEQMEKRFARAKKELARKDGYDYQVVNDDKEKAAKQLIDIIQKERKARRKA